MSGKLSSGLLFICFQRNIEKGFEYIKKNFLNNKDFPVPELRKNFNSNENERRRQFGCFKDSGPLSAKTDTERRSHYRFIDSVLQSHSDAQNTGMEGLSGPSELGVYAEGQFPITLTLGGGYYFIPPIPKKKISQISEQFFT